MIFYKVSGKIVEAINGNVDLEEIKVRSIDASVEKHVPQVEIKGNKVIVTVGSVIHPMEEKHYIEFIEIETKNGVQRKNLKPGDEPKAIFVLEDDEFVNAYAYCNLHGMWDGK